MYICIYNIILYNVMYRVCGECQDIGYTGCTKNCWLKDEDDAKPLDLGIDTHRYHTFGQTMTNPYYQKHRSNKSNTWEIRARTHTHNRFS